MNYDCFINTFLAKRNQRMAKGITPEQKQRAEKRLSEIGDRKPKWNEIELKGEIERLKAVVSFEKNLANPDFDLTDFAEEVKIK